MKQRGFTLTEVLVFIAFIGIITALVLFSVTTARTIAEDARIKAAMDSLRVEAEVYFDRYTSYAGFCQTESLLRLQESIAESTMMGVPFEARCGHFYYVAYADLITGPAYCVDSSDFVGEIPENESIEGWRACVDR